MFTIENLLKEPYSYNGGTQGQVKGHPIKVPHFLPINNIRPFKIDRLNVFLFVLSSIHYISRKCIFWQLLDYITWCLYDHIFTPIYFLHETWGPPFYSIYSTVTVGEKFLVLKLHAKTVPTLVTVLEVQIALYGKGAAKIIFHGSV